MFLPYIICIEKDPKKTIQRLFCIQKTIDLNLKRIVGKNCRYFSKHQSFYRKACITLYSRNSGIERFFIWLRVFFLENSAQLNRMNLKKLVKELQCILKPLVIFNPISTSKQKIISNWKPVTPKKTTKALKKSKIYKSWKIPLDQCNLVSTRS